MKSRILTLFILASIPFSHAGAQAKVNEVVTSNYNRNSVSFIAVQRGDSYDSDILAAVKSFDPGEKFDQNAIPTQSLRISNRRAISSQSSLDYVIPAESVNNAVGSKDIGRQILSYIFNRDGNGYMNDKLIRYRGNYDAKDQDVINARASRVGIESLGDAGHSLVSRSYVVVVDPFLIEKHTNDKGKVTWTTSVKGYAYKLGITPEELNDFYDQCWVYEDDTPEVKEAKLKAFNNFNAAMVPVTVVSSSGSSSNVRDAVSNALGSLIPELENHIYDWKVAVTISARKPLRAKIGSKEGLKNGDRYRAYSYKEDREGNLMSVARGFLRATEISENSGMALGETEPSKFYQISGLANIEEGWTIKQSNDIKLGVGLGLRAGGLIKGASLGLDIDYLTKVRTGGSMSYLLFSGVLDFRSNSGYSGVYAGFGYGYAIHLTRFIELMPYLMLGDDYISYLSSSSYETESSFLSKSALVFEPGVRAALNVAYPLQLYSKIYADLLTLQGSMYKTGNHYLGHHSSVGVEFGVKWTF